ncbi:MAG: saccharopine dehydrogenase NADP-binding domain-containing protein [Alphaproteobacteria bacterium]|nr:saccharopine dehydrogenase NADP-binding domain-containing protein [Alphaproteobacteria bacterium]
MTQKIRFSGRIVILGYGSVGRCILPAIPKHFDVAMERICVVAEHDYDPLFVPWRDQGVNYVRLTLTSSNLDESLEKLVQAGDLLINLTAGVDALKIIEWCHHHHVLYVDTSLEPWAEAYQNSALPNHTRTHYAAHQQARAMAAKWPKDSATAIVTHGANPGMVNHFVKVALLKLAENMGLAVSAPKNRTEWADLAHRTGTKVIHISERDTQRSSKPKQPDEFANSWSVLGFWGESLYPADLGWGTHEKSLPPLGYKLSHGHSPDNAIYINRPGGETLVRSWVPKGGPIYGMVISHSESITLSDYLTKFDAHNHPIYRPTVHYAYCPSGDGILSLREMAMRGWQPPDPDKVRILGDDIVDGIDELGVLLLGHGRNAAWYGSQLSIHEARKIIPGQNATSLQVCAGVMSACVYAVQHPKLGYCEPEDLPHDEIMAIAAPYLGPMIYQESDWTPLKSRTKLFPDATIDASDPWQFTNFLVR